MNWRTLDDLCGSDHHPVVVEVSNVEPHVAEVRYMEHRAHWKLFNCQTYIDFTEELLAHHNSDELVNIFNEHIIGAAETAIPKSKGTSLPNRVPWWSTECQVAINERKEAYKKYNRSKLLVHKIDYCRKRAKAKRVQADAKRSSWQKFVSGFNVNTPMSKMWKRISKIRGKYSNYTTPCLLKDGLNITDEAELVEIIACH